MYPLSLKCSARLHIVPLLHHRKRPTQFLLDECLCKGMSLTSARPATRRPGNDLHYSTRASSAASTSSNAMLSHLEDLRRARESDTSSGDESRDSFFSSAATIEQSMQLPLLIRDYQAHGHMMAALDPLGLDVPDIADHLMLYGFTDADLDRQFFLSSGILCSDNNNPPVLITLREMLAKLRETYCGSIGYEYMHILDRDRRNWLQDRIEAGNNHGYDKTRRMVILERLVRATQLESYLAETCPTAKRYGLDGAETLLPGMEALFDKAAVLGVESVVVGTSHRGRLNLMANVFRRPVSRIISELTVGPRPVQLEDSDGPIYTGTGELYLQQGVSCDRPTITQAEGRGNKVLHLSLVAHPCHLEAVDPVGDRAFAGQGVVYETLNLTALRGYTTGGTVHVVLNNRVAATADNSAGMSSLYCTDVAKALGAPVFHVNGDDVEAVVRVCELAVEWRHKFHSDVVVDLSCYRRFGHNELDDPTVTLPKMYQIINNHPSSLNIYEQMLQETGEISSEELQMIHDKVNKILNEESAKSKDCVSNKRDWLSGNWSGLKPPEKKSLARDTGVNLEELKLVGQAIITLPKTFKPHKAALKIWEQRAMMIQSGEGIDWAFAEALAFAKLVADGYHVRLSGQDVERGNFNQRHAILHDQETGEKYCPLDHVVTSQKKELFTVTNSLLSEFAVLGFEMGYSMENPSSLVLWEAQFGDFANCAQVIFDQFLSCAEARWLRQTGLVVLLPHGYDGVGPDHSGAHLERFLQMCDDNPFVVPEMEPSLCRQIQECNWQVVNVTSPANYFHVLRRQSRYIDFRKPLIVMTPKNLLRHKDCKSNLSDFDDAEGHPDFEKQGPRFKRLIADPRNHKQVYYELDKERENSGRGDVAICRIEQLCPFPYDLVHRELKRYPKIVWCQEEPMNMGAYSYIAPRLHTAMNALGRGSFSDIKYVGRLTSAAAATGFPSVHVQEQLELVKKALQQEPIKFP